MLYFYTLLFYKSSELHVILDFVDEIYIFNL